jgi:hypothetical protein
MNVDLVKALFGGDPMVVAIDRGPAAVRDVLENCGVPLVTYDHLRGALIAGDGSLLLRDLPGTPTCPCIIVAGGAETEQAVAELSSTWDAALTILDPESNGSDILGQLVKLLLERQAGMARQNRDLLGQIVALRSEAERVQSMLFEVNRAPRVEEPALETVLSPTGVCCAPPGGQSGALSFDLPCKTWALAKFDLRFERRLGQGTLYVALSVTDDNSLLGEWTAEYGTLQEDWHPFPLVRVCALRAMGLTLAVTWQTDAGAPPGLMMSGATALPQGEAFLDLPVEVVCIPALRTWRAPPSLS